MSARTRISLFILTVLALHALPVLSYQGVRQTRWPFLVWAMYARSYPAGPIEIVLRNLVAVSPEGGRRDVDPSDFGLPGPAFRNNYLAPFSRGDTTAGRLLIDRVSRVLRDSVVQIRLETVRYRLVDPGVAVDTLPPIVYPPTPLSAR